MNALWISRMSRYQRSKNALESARRVVRLKIERQNALLRRYKKPAVTIGLDDASSVSKLLLLEARAARHFWRQMRVLLPQYPSFAGREPYAADVVNKLLDIGYHHLAGAVRKICEQQQVTAALGLLHVARSAKSEPLVYDLMELFRSDVIDAELLRFLRLKKKKITGVGQSDISHFLHEVNERMERKYYIKEFKSCQTYRYYMELQVLKFIKAINNGGVFMPLHLPVRHDNRCRAALAHAPAPAIVSPGDLRQSR